MNTWLIKAILEAGCYILAHGTHAPDHNFPNPLSAGPTALCPQFISPFLGPISSSFTGFPLFLKGEGFVPSLEPLY